MEYQQLTKNLFPPIRTFLLKTSFSLAFFASTYDRVWNLRLAGQMLSGRTINTACIRIFVAQDNTQNRVKTKLRD